MIGTLPGIVLGVAAIAFGAWGFAPAGYPFLKLRAQGRGTSKVIGSLAILLGGGFLGIAFWSEGLMARR